MTSGTENDIPSSLNIPPSMPPDEKKIQKLKIILAIVFGSVVVLELGYIAALLHLIRYGY